ncbi:hypothetical protein [Spirillospora sp. NPDC029432]|uniref:hypothetical protein n=1 Tax=Spirillospora sp. NPDC029432 TaxID=3154599 RepID=UPI003453C475
MRVNVHVPIRIRLAGTPDAERLADLSRTVARLVGARLAESERRLARAGGHGAGTAARGEVREPYSSSSSSPSEEQEHYLIPSYAGSSPAAPGPAGGRQARVPVVRRAARPWVVLRSVPFRTTVGRFLGWLEAVRGAPMPDAELYGRMLAGEQWAEVWWVRAGRTYDRDELAAELVARASRLAGTGDRSELAWALSPFEGHRTLLAALDGSGAVAAGVPAFGAHNARRTGGGALLHGGWAVFAFMRLPRVRLADLAEPGPGRWLDLPVRQAGFVVDAGSFEHDTGVPWDRYAEEFARETLRVWVRAAEARPPVDRAALFTLLDHEAGDPPPGLRQASDLFLLGGDAPARLPEPVAAVARGGPWNVLYVRALLDLAPDRLGAALHGPRARELAARFLALLPGAPDDPAWRDAMLALMWRFEPLPHVRPPGGTLFEHVLNVLDGAGRLETLFDAAEASSYEGLRYRLLLLCLPTRYAAHSRVVRLRAFLAAKRRADAPHGYVAGGPGTGALLLEKDQRRTVRAGAIFGDVDSIYISRKPHKRLKPAPAARLREAFDRERDALAARILTGATAEEYDERSFAAAVIARAAAAAGVTDADFEEVVVERSIRLLEVLATEHSGVPGFDVRFEFVERVKGEEQGWTGAGGEVTENAGAFEGRLIALRLARAGEVYETATVIVLGVGALVVGWEIGAVALLLRLGGGAGQVAGSIGFAEATYIVRAVTGDTRITLRGFLEAALDGYLMAVGFRLGGALGRWTATRIGTGSARLVVRGWVAEKLLTGAVGGAAQGLMQTFAHDVIKVGLGEGSWSSAGTYVRAMAFNAALGVVAEFTAVPLLKSLLERAPSARELAALLRANGWNAGRWAAQMTQALARLRAALGAAIGETGARFWTEGFRERVQEVVERMGGELLARRVLELHGATFSAAAARGLERFLAAAGAAKPERSVRLMNEFAAHPQETVHFLEVLATMDESAVRHLAVGTFGGTGELAAFLGRLGRYTPEQQRAAIGLLERAGIVAGPPRAGAPPLRRQFELSQRLQARALEAEAANAQKRAEAALEKAAAADAHNPARAERLRALAKRELADAAALRTRAAGFPHGGPLPELPGPREAEEAIDALVRRGGAAESGTLVRVPRAASEHHPELIERLVRPVFRSRTGNRVVFRVEGGTGIHSSKAYHSVGRDGSVSINTKGDMLNLNFGVFERALEFLIGHRPGGRLVVYEIDEAWFSALRGSARPELEAPPETTRLVDVRFAEDQLQLPPDLIPELLEFVVPGSGRVLEFAP